MERGNSSNSAVMLSMPRPEDSSLARLSSRNCASPFDSFAGFCPGPGAGRNRRTALTVAWLPRFVSQTPSQPSRMWLSADRSVRVRTSGTPEIICFSGGWLLRVRLYAKSPSALLRFRLSSMRPSFVTQPPAAFILSNSSRFFGLWSCDMAVAMPRSSQSTQRESPQLATCSRMGRCERSKFRCSSRATTAVQPMPSGLSAQSSSNISTTLSPSASQSASSLRVSRNCARTFAASARTMTRPGALSSHESIDWKASRSATG
mmetsp:Transcript_37649/g.112372  ORF Transcript_37649/g.112372 Transcript_37649/m.112372 type:complete len:261 (-) Transcript_37649:229-1011(-)